MPQIIRVKRNVTSINGPATLDPGELGYTGFGAVHNLYIGDGTLTVQNLVNPLRQVEMTGDQGPIAGIKTFGPTGEIIIPVANLGVTGGNAGEAMITDGAGNISFAPIVSASQQFVGSLDAAAATATFTAASGITGTALPAAATANNGMYVITDVAGATPPTGAPAGQYEVGDWVISNGSVWTHLAFGGISSVTASDVGVVAPLTGPTVQDELVSIQTDSATHVVGPAAAVADHIATYDGATGLLIKDSGTLVTDLVTNASFTASQAAQDALIAASGDVFGPATAVAGNIAVYSDATGKLIADGAIQSTDLVTAADLVGMGDVVGPASVAATLNLAVYSGTTGKLIADGGQTIAQIVAAAGDVKGPAAAVGDNIAVYDLTTGKLIKDGGVAIAALALKTDITTAQADDVKIAGSTMTGPLLLSEHPVAGTSPLLQAATVQYVDTAITSIPGAAPPVVTAPELTGDGTSGTPITFTGITIAANSALELLGKGLSTNPLDLVLVDGGTYA